MMYANLETINNAGFIKKSKLNTNGTFSVGKTWRLAELRGIQVTDVREYI
jgi:exocyst complex component 1